MEKCKKRKVTDEKRMFNLSWTDSFAFIASETGLPVCLLCNEKLANNKKSNVERHFLNKHNVFAEKYPAGDQRKKVVLELRRRANQSKTFCSKSSSTSSTSASFIAAREIACHGKPFTDGEYLKETFIKISEHLFSDFKDKNKIIQKIKDMPLLAKIVKDRTIRMAANISSQQISDINSAPGYSIACDGSKDISDVEQISLFCKYVNSTGLKEEFIEIIPTKRPDAR